MASLPRERLPLLVQRIKVLAGLLTYRSDRPQDGRINAEATPAGVELRVAVLPTLHGEKAALRLLGHAGPRRLEELDWPDHAAEALTGALRQPQGLLLFAGPAGSGKTTSIYAALRALAASGERACVTIEDPIEAALSGVDQTEVDRGAGLGFANALRALLRHDPEVLFVGEVRDAETARTAVEAGLTGHLVLTTVHAGGACEALLRLRDLGVEPYALGASLSAAFAQRLLRRNCTSCTALLPAPDDDKPLLKALHMEQVESFHRGEGCKACGHTGYFGRTAVFEMIPVDDGLRELATDAASAVKLRQYARQQGYGSLRDDGRRLIKLGSTTPAEVMRVTRAE